MKKTLFKITISILAFYITTCGFFFLFQEKLIFQPKKLDLNFHFNFNEQFEEINIKSYDGISINGLLFKTDNSKGLIFFLHGNARAIDSWGNSVKTYVDLGYDVFMMDYRGFGKSEGNINSEEQIHKDVKIVYESLKKRYSEKNIIVMGYSIGTGLAAKLASQNNPKLLILLAPYFNLEDLLRHKIPVIPNFILKYKLETNNYIQACHMPIFIFHGNRDNVIYYKSSIKLKEFSKNVTKLVILDDQEHKGISENPVYKNALKYILIQYQ